MTIPKRDRYRGAMVGLLAGDALGAPYETWDILAILEDMRDRGGLVAFDYPNPWAKEFPLMVGNGMMPKGRPTDDSDHAAALAKSIVACGGLNEADLYARLRHVVYGHVSPLWEGKAVGSGRTTRRALKPETWEESKARPFDPDEYPSNGALMRSAPMALYIGTEARAKELNSFHLSTAMARVTHRNKYAGMYTAVYVEMLLDILNGEVPSIVAHKSFPADPGKWPERGHAEFSYQTALWAFKYAEDFRDGLTKVILVGGDTDTYGAIAGGLLGAYYGIDGIPQEWRSVLKGHDVMVDLADKLYDMAHPASS